jgi:hypothetical protein
VRTDGDDDDVGLQAPDARVRLKLEHAVLERAPDRGPSDESDREAPELVQQRPALLDLLTLGGRSVVRKATWWLAIDLPTGLLDLVNHHDAHAGARGLDRSAQARGTRPDHGQLSLFRLHR